MIFLVHNILKDFQIKALIFHKHLKQQITLRIFSTRSLFTAAVSNKQNFLTPSQIGCGKLSQNLTKHDIENLLKFFNFLPVQWEEVKKIGLKKKQSKARVMENE